MIRKDITYNVHGIIMNTDQLRQKIIDILGENNRLTVREIEAELGLEPQRLSNVITTMSANHLILVDTIRDSKRHVKYYNHPKSMLQNIFHPLPQGYENMKGKVYKETHAKHNNKMRVPYETFNFSSMYSLAE
jgi:DNA-binding Lrp family transcriptional regulator